MNNKLLTLILTFVSFGFSSAVFAYDFGSGTGCSALAGIDVTALTDGDKFTGRIGVTGVSGFNKNGKPADDSDGDGFTNSLEECINDSLVGYYTTLLDDDSSAISVLPGSKFGRNGNQQEFTVTFVDVSGCGISQCSDHVDNEGSANGLIDFPADPECSDYDDNGDVIDGGGVIDGCVIDGGVIDGGTTGGGGVIKGDIGGL